MGRMSLQLVDFPVLRVLTRERERLCGYLRLTRSGTERLLPRPIDGFSGKVYCESPQRHGFVDMSRVPDAVHGVRGLEVPCHLGLGLGLGLYPHSAHAYDSPRHRFCSHRFCRSSNNRFFA